MDPNQNYPTENNPGFQPQPQTQVPTQPQPIPQAMPQPIPQPQPQYQQPVPVVNNNIQQNQSFPINQNVATPIAQPLPQQMPQQAQPQMPTQPVMPQFQQPQPQSQQQPQNNYVEQPVAKKKLSKKLIIIIASVSAALIIGLVLFVVYAVFFAIDYKDAYTKSNEVAQTWNDFSAKYNEVNDLLSDGDDEELATGLTEGKSAFNKFKTAYKQLDGATVLRDKSVKEKYDLFKKQTDLVVPKIEAYFEIVTPLHEFVAKSEEISSSGAMTDTEIDDITSPLVNSTNSKLKQFGKDFTAAAKKFYSAIEAYNVSHSSADYEKALDAKDEFTDLVSDKEALEKRIGVVTSSDISDLRSAWQGLKDKISDKYSALQD